MLVFFLNNLIGLTCLLVNILIFVYVFIKLITENSKVIRVQNSEYFNICICIY